ncbi:hypothetical protein P152DRAFT_453239 [Eremomyces bilateralis CBS 781.70]|uniref:Uncharacterized protein n=1 Tax=Eremomyces bilateralis CBS 781.70 TaxID=1392243 RepID=A0A6G1FQH7_9PEZI|nr:uncharacterized protein P152DRAFT_453239 [Eremomyces bilateralis CBS 781.70]KAF1807996.1 hypothetical protein P152DRAFT_453239 [Eremomyces bilateralis CBS 781.70]
MDVYVDSFNLHEGGQHDDSALHGPTTDLDVTVHVAAGISYDRKGIFFFYSDPAEPAAKEAYKPAKPRRSNVQTEEEYQAVLGAWNEAPKGSELDADIKINGNSMTQRFMPNISCHVISIISRAYSLISSVNSTSRRWEMRPMERGPQGIPPPT